ncbi:hypothetical protein [Trinickia diaoshuihuensis]|uniref:hypothetical protein n=1 Tax=Trinickia diaoshuihuensis TaxID=2292265 RepID=UPI000E22D5E0|nr:hypothetical protein [Trinickia diaoshuihuensis]
MKVIIHAAGLLLCSVGIAVAQATLASAQPSRAPASRLPPEMSATWRAARAAAPSSASAPRGNLRGDIESNARWNDNGQRPRDARRR